MIVKDRNSEVTTAIARVDYQRGEMNWEPWAMNARRIERLVTARRLLAMQAASVALLVREGRTYLGK